MKRQFGVVVAGTVIALVLAACGSSTPSATPSGGVPASIAPATSSASAAPVNASPEVSSGSGAEFEPIAFKGKGDQVITFDIPDDAIAIASLSHPGTGPFEVTAYGEDGKPTQRIIKTTGKYAGTRLFDLVDHSVSFKVAAKGPWKITVKSTDSAKVWDQVKPLKGKGDAVVLLPAPSVDGDTLAVKTTGKSRFALRAHSADDEVYIIDSAGPIKVEKDLPEGTQLLEISTKAPWTLTKGP